MPNPYLGKLTLREWAVLLLLSEKKSVPEIADQLCIEPKSVHNNKNRISRKLHLPGFGELNLFAGQHRDLLFYWYGILTPGKGGPGAVRTVPVSFRDKGFPVLR